MTKLLQPGQIPKATGDPPRVIPPDAGSIFAHRARRFAALAPGHSLDDYLQFMGHLADAQQKAADRLPAVALPDEPALALAREHRMPPIPAQRWPREALWRDALRTILNEVAAHASPAAVRSIEGLHAMDDDAAEGLAARVLGTELYGEHADKLPFVAAALQVYWTKMAAQAGTTAITPIDVPGVCPCCGGLPVISVIGACDDVPGLRYLHCSLCNTQWNLTRVKCSVCDGPENAVSYRHIDGSEELVQAEVCETCKCYLKIVRRDRNATVDAVADDLATLALDILVDASGYSRSGPNLLLVPGEV